MVQDIYFKGDICYGTAELKYCLTCVNPPLVTLALASQNTPDAALSGGRKQKFYLERFTWQLVLWPSSQFWNQFKSSNCFEDMAVQSFSHKICSCTKLQYDTTEQPKKGCYLLELFYCYLRRSFNKTTNCKKISHKNLTKRKSSPNMIFCLKSGLKELCKKLFLCFILLLIWQDEYKSE